MDALKCIGFHQGGMKHGQRHIVNLEFTFTVQPSHLRQYNSLPRWQPTWCVSICERLHWTAGQSVSSFYALLCPVSDKINLKEIKLAKGIDFVIGHVAHCLRDNSQWQAPCLKPSGEGDIEARLSRCPFVRYNAVVITKGDRNNRQLADGSTDIHCIRSQVPLCEMRYKF